MKTNLQTPKPQRCYKDKTNSNINMSQKDYLTRNFSLLKIIYTFNKKNPYFLNTK